MRSDTTCRNISDLCGWFGGAYVCICACVLYISVRLYGVIVCHSYILCGGVYIVHEYICECSVCAHVCFTIIWLRLDYGKTPKISQLRISQNYPQHSHESNFAV